MRKRNFVFLLIVFFSFLFFSLIDHHSAVMTLYLKKAKKYFSIYVLANQRIYDMPSSINCNNL